MWRKKVSAVHPERPDVVGQVWRGIKVSGESTERIWVGDLNDAEEQALSVHTPGVAYEGPVAICGPVAVAVVLRRGVVVECIHDELRDIEWKDRVMPDDS